MKIREARSSDADAMGAVLEELVAEGKRATGDAAFALSHYIEHPQRLHCFVAVADDRTILGLQSLKRAWDGNPYGTPIGWGIIGTHVRPSAARMGVGSRLFAATLEAAGQDGLSMIEAYIGAENQAALGYYEALGFRTCRSPEGILCKALQISRSSAA